MVTVSTMRKAADEGTGVAAGPIASCNTLTLATREVGGQFFTVIRKSEASHHCCGALTCRSFVESVNGSERQKHILQRSHVGEKIE